MSEELKASNKLASIIAGYLPDGPTVDLFWAEFEAAKLRVEFNDHAPAARDADAWQWRACISGEWGNWLNLEGDPEKFKNGPWKWNLEHGSVEIRPLYAAPLVRSAARSDTPWQDISTAPRDGTPVLLWAEAWEMTWGTQLGAYSVIDQMWETGEGSVSDNDADFDPDAEVDDEDLEFDDTRNVGPTHWAPVPRPPSLARNDRGSEAR